MLTSRFLGGRWTSGTAFDEAFLHLQVSVGLSSSRCDQQNLALILAIYRCDNIVLNLQSTL